MLHTVLVSGQLFALVNVTWPMYATLLYFDQRGPVMVIMHPFVLSD
jgi:hypothetical protein